VKRGRRLTASNSSFGLSLPALNLKRIRGFLLLDQRDVELATGVPVYRLAKAEQGRITLNDAERRVLTAFYKARWKMAMEECATDEQFTLNS
jgi:hypothetical protein